MEFIKTRGVVINKRDIGEADRYITVFTEKVGKIDFLIKGIRKSKKRAINTSEVLTVSNFSFYKKGERYILNTIDLIEDYSEIKLDIEKLQQCYYILSVINKIVYPAEIKKEFFQRVERALNYIQKNQVLNNYFLILKMLQWILEDEGYRIMIEGERYLNISESVISDSRGEGSIALTTDVFNIIESLIKRERVEVKNSSIVIEIIKLYERYLNYHLETDIKIDSYLFGGEFK